MLIQNKIYEMQYSVNIDSIFVHLFSIQPKYRGRKYSKRIFKNLKKEHKKPTILECWPTLIKFYIKIGFRINYGPNKSGYYEMINLYRNE